MAARPKTLLISAAPLLLCQFLAWQALDQSAPYLQVSKHIQSETAGASTEDFSWLLALLCFSCALLLQVAVNLANDYFDYIAGVDDHNRLGPIRLSQQGLLRPQQIKSGFLLSLTLGVVAGLAVILLSSGQLFWFGGLCVVAVLTYTSGPLPLAYNGLGEVAVFCIFGPVAVMGGYYAQCLAVPWILCFPGFAMGALAAAIMLINNIRDADGDQKAGKRTVVAYIGLANSRRAYQVLIILAAVCSTIFSAILAVAVFSVLMLPLGLWLCRQFKQRSGSQLNHQLAQTAQFMLVCALSIIADVGGVSVVFSD